MGSVPIGRGNPCGTVRSVRGPVGVVVRFGVRTFGSDFGVGLWGVIQLSKYSPDSSELSGGFVGSGSPPGTSGTSPLSSGHLKDSKTISYGLLGGPGGSWGLWAGSEGFDWFRLALAAGLHRILASVAQYADIGPKMARTRFGPELGRHPV